MGKINRQSDRLSFTPIQRLIFDEFSRNSKLRNFFYFTGGTALSAVYLHHRESEDLDFFSESDFNNEIIEEFINNISKIIKIPMRSTQIEKTRMYEFVRASKVIIKIDFGHYPYKRLKKGIKTANVTVDNMFDIATNKLHTITSRTEVKDFVDLYFLLKKFSFWDLYHGVTEKFRMEIDLIWLASDFLKVNEFESLPKMLLPLTLDELKEFYRKQAKKIVSRVIE